MAQHEVTRTLVKSQPEVWAQCSEADSLERHLSGSFGEIRITRLEPEHAVAWEGEQVRGTVKIEPSAWGTRVTMAVDVEDGVGAAAINGAPPIEPPALPAEPIVPAEPEPVEAEAEERVPPPTPPAYAETSAAPPSPPAEPEASVAPLSPLAGPPGAVRRHRFGRWWKRHRRPAGSEGAARPADEPPASPPTDDRVVDERPAPEAPEPHPPADATAPAAPLEPTPDATAPAAPLDSTPDATAPAAPLEPTPDATPSAPPPEPAPDFSAALQAALESLGQAHHRPYSRA